MTPFDYIKDILVEKKGNLSLDEYVPYLINRWLSFINPTVCSHIGLLNKKHIIEDKHMHYKLALTLFPKLSAVPFIKYIKKTKLSEKNTEQEKNEEIKIKCTAQTLELSEKECRFLYKQQLES